MYAKQGKCCGVKCLEKRKNASYLGAGRGNVIKANYVNATQFEYS